MNGFAKTVIATLLSATRQPLVSETAHIPGELGLLKLLACAGS